MQHFINFVIGGVGFALGVVLFAGVVHWIEDRAAERRRNTRAGRARVRL